MKNSDIDFIIRHAIFKRMKDDKEFLTPEEKRDIESELKELKEVKRMEVIEQLKVARSYGDLSENAEYDAARKKQGEIESRITEIEGILKGAEIVDKKSKKLQVGTRCVPWRLNCAGAVRRCTIFGRKGGGIEASSHSPIAQELIGKKVGDVVVVTLPKKELTMTVTKIL